MNISPTDADVFEALRGFLLAILPAGTPVIKAQVNRVPEVGATDFVLMNEVLRTRLATNVDSYADALFDGAIAGTTMTITDVISGEITLGAMIFGVGVAPNTVVTAFNSGSGGTGTYTVSPSQTVASGALSAGTKALKQETSVTIQLDVHGDAGGDNAQIITTLMRDASGVAIFAALNPAISPLYATDPRQMPFLNENQQIETRWVLDVVLQVDPTVAVPQQFADAVDIEVISVDATYPP